MFQNKMLFACWWHHIIDISIVSVGYRNLSSDRIVHCSETKGCYAVASHFSSNSFSTYHNMEIWEILCSLERCTIIKSKLSLGKGRNAEMTLISTLQKIESGNIPWWSFRLFIVEANRIHKFPLSKSIFMRPLSYFQSVHTCFFLWTFE